MNSRTESTLSEHDPLAGDGIVPLGGELEAVCPACGVRLRTGQIDERPALYCSECCGVLLRCGDFGTVLRNRRAQRHEWEDSPPVDRKAFARSLDCPSCSRVMETHPYYGPGNVVIDSCGSCDLVWLDHNELSELAKAVDHRRPR